MKAFKNITLSIITTSKINNTVEPDLCVYEGEEKMLFVTQNYLEIRFR